MSVYRSLIHSGMQSFQLQNYDLQGVVASLTQFSVHDSYCVDVVDFTHHSSPMSACTIKVA